MNTVATNLLGRWVRGRWVHLNSKYVPASRGMLDGYTKAELKELTEYQRTRWVYSEVEEKIVAVTSEGSDRYAELKFWVLIDGKSCFLEEDATVMPEGWHPVGERL